MREINLNGKQYKIKGEVTKRAISPWMAQVSSGTREYSDFSQAQLQEYHDLRNGIGLESDLPSESNRTWFTEGIDFTSPRSAVLSPLVTTATGFGVAPVKILDFQGKTYAIGADTTKVWNTTESRWDHVSRQIEDCEDVWDFYQNPNATHAVDSGDRKEGSNSLKITVDSSIVGEMLALETITSIDLTGYSHVTAWIKSQLAASSGDLQIHLCSGATWTSPTGFVDAESGWTNEPSAYDDNTGTEASSESFGAEAWSEFLELTHAALSCDSIRFWGSAGFDTVDDEIDVDIYYGSAWHHVYEGTFAEDEWVTKYFLEGTQTITAARVRFYNGHAVNPAGADLDEFDFGEITTDQIDITGLSADTWTEVNLEIGTPANLGTVTRIGLKSVTDLGTEPYDIRLDDVRVRDTNSFHGTPIDAIVITDKNDEWLIVSDEADAHYWAGGATDAWKELITWHEGHSTNAPDGGWSNNDNLIDDDTTSSANDTNIGNGVWSKFLEVIEDPSQRIDRIRYFIHSSTGSDVDLIDIDVEYNNAWHDVFQGAFTENEWVVKMLTDSMAHDVTKIRIRAHADGAATDDVYVSGLQWGAGPSEYMATFANRLYWMGTDGSGLNFCGVGDITSIGGHWDITGDVGRVYGLFEGKLLADGTPALYFHGTKGLYSLDTTNEIAYRQEVEYPPLTNAGRAAMYWNGSIWVATGFGILKVTPSLATYVGPDQDDGLPEGYQGSIFAMTTVNNWLVYCVNRTTFSDKSSILKRNASYGGSLQVYTAPPPLASTETLRPNAAGDENALLHKDGSAGDANNYQEVDEVGADDDTTYVYKEGASFIRDLYNVGDSSGSDPINFIKVYARCKFSSGIGVGWVLLAIKSGTGAGAPDTVDESAGFAVGESYSNFNNEWTTNPATGSPWTWEEIDNLQIGISLGAALAKSTRCTQVYVEVNYTLGKIACLHHSPSSLYTNGRLWFGEGTDIKYMMFPDTTSNVKQISTYQYVDDSGYGKFPIFRKLAAITKVALGVAAITKSCDSNEFIQVFYGLNGAAPTTSLGTFITSPRPTTLTFNSGVGTEFYTIQFAIKLFRGSTITNSPELESLLFYYMPRPTTINAWTFNVECILDTSEELITAFEAIRDTKVLVPFYPTGDTAKDVYNVALTTMPMRFYVENQTTRAGVISVTVQEVFNG